MKRILLIILVLAFPFSSVKAQYKVGDAADDFLLKNIDGKQVSLADYPEAKGFVVIFTCNHCPYSIAYEDRIIAIDGKYKSKGFPVIAINPNDPEVVPADSWENMKKRSKEKGFTFPYLLDENQAVFREFGATRTPHVFLLSKKGNKMTVEYIGAIDNNYKDESQVTQKYLEDAIEALLEGKKPNPNYTKAIGCTIKSKSAKGV